jgi:CRISPR type IV-associated DEAD/DEAH-box helicase Csf4
VKEKVSCLLREEVATELVTVPTPRASTHESMWLNEEQVTVATRLGERFGLSTGEVVTAVLLRDFEAWEAENKPSGQRPTERADDAGALGRALARRESVPRKEQLDVLRCLREFVTQRSGEGEVLFCEAGTGTGKTLAYLAAAVELLATDKCSRVMVAAPTFALMEQIGQELALFGEDAPSAVLLAGQGEWVSQGALERFLAERNADVSPGQEEKLKAWLETGGSSSGPRWSMLSLVDSVPDFAFVDQVTVARRNDDDDEGYHAYVNQFSRAADARVVVLTHAMLAWLVKRRMLAQFRALKGNENVADAVAAWRGTPAKEREQRFHEALNLALAEEGSDAGCDRLPDVDLLIVDEAHALEDAFANVFSVEGSVGSLLGDAASLHKRFPAVFLRDGLDRLKAVFGVLQALCQGNGADQIMSMAEMPGLMKELTSALLDAVKAKPGASKKLAAAAAGTREAKRVRAMAASLGVAEDAMAKGATWAAAYLHWSPKKAYPRVSVGKLWLDQELHYLWGVVAKRTALVSGTLYEENPSYSCETVRRALAVPIAKVVQMVPIHARWQVDPVELRMVPAVHAADGRPRYVRPSAKQEESVRGAEGAKWLDDVSGYVRELLLTNATAGGVLVLGTAFADIEGVEQRLKTGNGVPAGWTVLAQRPGVGLAGLRKEFMDASLRGKVALLAVGGAWTGFDLHSNESPDALTDLVILNAPFGLMGKTVARLRRQASKTGHFEVASHALLLVRQGVGRLVRSPETPHNRRIHWLDGRIYDPSLAGMFYGIKRFLGRYRSIAVA